MRVIFEGGRAYRVIVFLLFFASSFAHSQTCKSSSVNQHNVADSAYPGPDGLIHVTYSFVDASGNPMTPAPGVAAAVQSAVGQWNGFSSTTLVQFDNLPNNSNVSADIQIQQTSDATAGGCAAYSASAGRIYYGPTFLQAVSNNWGATILAHEFGHAEGLGEGGTSPSPPSIMNNPSNPLPGGCTSPVVATTTVQPNDAGAIGGCQRATHAYVQFQQARAGITTKDDGDVLTFSATSSGQTCSYTYREITFYVDGRYDSSELQLDSLWCY